MLTTSLRYLIIISALFLGKILTAQTCNGTPFNSPGKPSTCTYTYTSTGWKDASGNSISKPSGDVLANQSVCIMANNSETIPGGNGKPKFRGTLYIAPNVKFSGRIDEFIGAKIVVEGTLDFNAEPDYETTQMYIHENGKYIEDLDLTMLAGSAIYNMGELITNGPAVFGGSSKLINYENAHVLAKTFLTTNEILFNCGLIEVLSNKFGAGGGNGFRNLCTIWSKDEMKINGNATNHGTLITENRFVFTGDTFTNYGRVIVDEIDLQDNTWIGNNDTSLLVVKKKAERGAGITGHYFYDIDDGGGFDDTCDSCLPGISILLANPLPPTNAELFENCGQNIEYKTPIPSATLDFDGVDDYISTNAFIGGLTDITLMAWVKSNSSNTVTIAGEDSSARLFLAGGKTPRFTVTTTGIGKTLSAPPIKEKEWHHITGSYSSSTKTLKLYVDGDLKITSTNVLSGSIANSALSNGNFEIGRRSSNIANKEYFKGEIDEVRVFNKALTDDQIQRIIYQEIANNNGKVRGAVIPKDIIDINTNSTVSWSNLLAYYPMTDIISFKRTTDYSSNNRLTYLNNITTIQEQTAPMPYETSSYGNWTSKGTWLHGDVWDIEDVEDNKDWSIVKLNHNVTTSTSHTHLGLYIAEDKTLTVEDDNFIENTWYLELNGTIDLEDDSQLIQGKYSDLVTSANGAIKRRQQGTSSYYHYNYWGSPVGKTAATTLTNNNADTNNPNNTTFRLSMLKDTDGDPISFTTARDGYDKLSTRWTYILQNGITYYDWFRINETTDLASGIGYIHKGLGVGSSQEFIFHGKPNNGTIKISVSDVGGNGSVTGSTRTNYLLGNPYPSALDLHKFIDDNAGIIDGTLQLWQQWAGSSHNLAEYEGGYATVNKSGSVRAFQFEGIEGGVTEEQNGTKTPTRYLPVGQGFIAEVKGNGNVEFNNSQRIFIKEADANNSYNQGSVFFRTRGENASVITDSLRPMSKLRLEFSNINGPLAKRELLLGFSDFTTDEYDYGYDAINSSFKSDDLGTIQGDDPMLIQAFSEIMPGKVVPLILNASGEYSYSIKASEFEHIDPKFDIFLLDNQANSYFKLKAGKKYTFDSQEGKYDNRLAIVFQEVEEKEPVAKSRDTSEEFIVFYGQHTNKLHVKGLDEDVIAIYLHSILGQTVKVYYNVSKNTLDSGLTLPNLSTGAYLVNIVDKTYGILTKKILMK